MTTTAFQLPVQTTDATRATTKLWRKQLLPIGSINYKGTKLDFTRDYLKGIVDNFNAKAYDQVALQMADADNTHTLDPERFRGEVKELELADDGLYGYIEPTETGHKVLADNPKLGVSVRIVPALERADGKKFGPSLMHVLGTLDPRVTAMKQWEPAMALATDDMAVVDLTAATFTNTEGAEMADDTKVDDGHVGTDGELDELTDAELEAILDAADTGDEKSAPGKPAAVVAASTHRTQEEIELANSNAREIAEIRAELAAEKWKGYRAELVRKGVAPAKLDIPGVAELAVSKSTAIELSNGTSIDPGEVIRQLLEQSVGDVDLSNEIGSPGSDSDNPELEAMLEASRKLYDKN